MHETTFGLQFLHFDQVQSKSQSQSTKSIFSVNSSMSQGSIS